MSDTAFKGSFDLPGDDDADQDLVGLDGLAQDEFISEIGQVMELPNADPADKPILHGQEDAEGYVDVDGHPQPHQSPGEVARQSHELMQVDADLHESPLEGPTAAEIRDLEA